VSSLTLINAQNGAAVLTITNGMTINLPALGLTQISIRANTSPTTVGSVVFGLDGTTVYKVETAAPYSIYGDTGTSYYAWPVSAGVRTVRATAYTGAGGTGTPGPTLTVSFTLVR
nr:hypothetical protein [Anaerolineae bacterium]